MIEIREATYDDVTAIARVHVQADWETYSALFGSEAYKIDSGESEERWRRALQRGDTLLVANDGSEIVGFGHASKNEIGALYLLRSYRRRGIGKALLLRVLATLNERGVAEARFDVVPANLNAIRFYKSLGAYPVGRCTNSSPRGATEELVFAISTFPAR
ncbi:MAG TPA: GNAT family N-acetyltransferase [Pseudolabrys sp.]|nr:GNAT family N-acetyltransferase [Pseudolabrys sp.]